MKTTKEEILKIECGNSLTIYTNRKECESISKMAYRLSETKSDYKIDPNIGEFKPTRKKISSNYYKLTITAIKKK